MNAEFVRRITKLEKRIDQLAGTRQLFDIGNDDAPAQFTANQNNFTPGNYDVLRLSSDASRDLTGITDGVRGRMLMLVNVGSNNIVLKHQSASSTAANRLLISSHADATLLPGQAASAYYDATTLRWRILYKPAISITGIYGSYYVNISSRHYETVVSYNDYAPDIASPASPFSALSYTGSTQSRAINMADGKIYSCYFISTTYYIKEYDMVTKTSVTLSVSVTGGTIDFDWAASSNRIAYFSATANTFDADIQKIYIYEFNFATSTVTLMEEIKAAVFDGIYYNYYDQVKLMVHVVNNVRYLLFFGRYTQWTTAPRKGGLVFYKKDIDNNTASVITSSINYGLIGDPTYTGYTYAPGVLYQFIDNKLYGGTGGNEIDVGLWKIDIDTGAITLYSMGLVGASQVSQTEISVDITSGKVHMVYSMTEAGPTYNNDVYEFDGSSISRIVRYAYTPTVRSALKLFKSKLHDYYYYVNDTTGTPTAGSLYDCVTQTLVSTISNSYSLIVYNVASRIVDDNNKIWFHDNVSNKLYSWFIDDGTITTITCTITKANTNPKYHLTFILGSYIAIVTVYGGSSSSVIWLVN